MIRKMSLLFSGGVVGGLLNSLTVWAFGKLGITAALGVKIAPQMSPQWLYPRLIWGGIWGLILILPLFNKTASGIRLAALISLFPTAIQLFVVFPIKAHKGYAGLDLGQLTPLFVILFNFVWALPVVWFHKKL